MTDAGYVLGGYALTAVTIGTYTGHMWVRNRTLVRLARARSDDVSPEGVPNPDEPRP